MADQTRQTQMKISLITNPHARRNRNGGDSKLVAEARKLGVSVFRIDKFDDLPALFAGMMADKPQLVIISGGDGTVHAIMSLLAERSDGGDRPVVALLPHGTTNVTALQISLRKPGPEQLGRICELAASGLSTQNIGKRRTIRIAGLDGQPPLHGFINAAGAIASATKRCQTNLNQRGWTGNFAVAMSLINDLAKKLFSADPEAGGLLASTDMELKTADNHLYEGETLTVMISTLDRLVLGTSPFWNIEDGALRILRVSHNPPDFFTNLYRILFGNKSKLPDSHFLGFSTQSLSLRLSGVVLIDGEFYTASDEKPLEISAGPEFDFIRL